jgi:RimJ/RimL family protein N-acetyltransferase
MLLIFEVCMNHNFSIEFNNVKLRPLELNDIESLRIWRNNPENSKYLKQIGYITPQQQIEWFHNYLNNDDEITFAIVDNEILNTIVGSVSLYNFKGGKAEFGKILIGEERAHKRNIGLNATKAVLKIAFDKLNLKEVFLECYEHNASAQKIYKKAGFVPTGEFRLDNVGKAIFYSISEI